MARQSCLYAHIYRVCILAVGPQETILADQSRKTVADAQFKKLQRVQDGKKAMSEYEAEQAAVRTKTARLKAARLAKEAADAATAAAAPPTPAKKNAKKSKVPAEKLTDWLDDQHKGGRNS